MGGKQGDEMPDMDKMKSGGEAEIKWRGSKISNGRCDGDEARGSGETSAARGSEDGNSSGKSDRRYTLPRTVAWKEKMVVSRLSERQRGSGFEDRKVGDERGGYLRSDTGFEGENKHW